MAKDNRKNAATSQNDDKMTVQEAGHLGGEATSESHDKKFYENIGHEGGEASSGKFAEGGGREKDKEDKREAA